MSERVFSISGPEASPAEPITLADAGLKERSDLQEWVLAHPEILGPEVMIVTFEFDHWRTAKGDRQLDRLDVLGIDADGRLVVGELKRDRAPDTVEMQAIKYAAMASRFTEDVLVEQYTRFLARTGEPDIDEETARERLLSHAGGLDPDQLRKPRIVLVAGKFPPIVTASAVWLSEMGLDLTLQQVQAYRVFDDRTIVTVSQVYPIPEVEEFTISPQRADAEAAAERRKGSREKSTVLKLVRTNALPVGTMLTLRPTTEVAAEVREQIAAWVAEDPRRGRAIWHGTVKDTMEWEADGERYRPTEIVRRILLEAAGLQRSPRGPSWWITDDGRDLPTIAGLVERSTFDWSGLHQILELLPSGRWTTYGDLADAVGTAAQPLGQHVTSCTECANAHRLLGANGRPKEGFAWSDPTRSDSQQDALEAEGVTFAGSQADPAARLSPDDIEGLVLTASG